MKINVLMTGAGAPGGPGIIKGLKQDKNIDLLVCDANHNASGRYLNDKYEIIPLAENDNFISFMLSLCKKYNIDIIFPLVTLELFKFSRNKELFENQGVKIIVSDYDSLIIANNKSALYKHLFEKKIVTPDFYVVNNFNQIKNAFLKLGYPNKPVCIKPSISNGSRGIRVIDNKINELDLLFNHKPNSLYMTYNKLIDILSENNFPELLASEYLPGEEYTIDSIVNNAKPEIIIPRKRSKMNGGISVAGEFEDNKEIISYCHEILTSLKLSGPIGLQVKKSNDGIFKILEINPRIQGTSIAAFGAGINLPLLSIYSTLGVNYKIPNMNWSTKFIRYYNEVFYE